MVRSFLLSCLCPGARCLIIHPHLFFVFVLLFPHFVSVVLPTLLHPSLLTMFPHQDGVTIGLEVLLPKEAKHHSDTSQPLQYDVFLYKVANNGDPASPSQGPPSHSSTSHPISRSPKTVPQQVPQSA